MPTNDQLLANRLNAEKSTGPTTDAGKQRSSQNSTRHGFTGQTVVLAPHEVEPYRLFTEGFLEAFAPVGTPETQLAYSVIDCRWRLNQLAAVESALYELGAMEHADRFKDKSPELAASLSRALTLTEKQKEFDRVHRYEARLHRQAAKDQAELNALQAARKAHELQQFRDAAALMYQAKSDRKPFNPAEFGFVWSEQEILLRADRAFRLKIANSSNSHCRDLK